MTSSRTVAILGAGPSGLVSGKEALENGLFPTIFEKESELGGVWNPTTGAVWNTMHTNISKFTTTFGDTPWPEDIEMFPSMQSMFTYLKEYALRWKLQEVIKFNSNVVKVIPNGDSDGDKGWTIHWTAEDGTKESKIFDAVIVATGIFQEAFIPEIIGLETFPGRILHSREYKTGEEFSNIRVLTIGGSFSGTEIAADVSNFSSKSYHTFRRPFWILKRYLKDSKHNDANIPLDLLFYTRDFYSQSQTQTQLPDPKELNTKKNQGMLSFCKEQQEFPELKVPQELFHNPVNITVSDHYLEHVKNNSITPIPGHILEIKGSKVIFKPNDEDKEVMDIEVDAIIFGTGFQPNSNYFPEHILQKISYEPSDHLQPYVLFQELLHPGLKNVFFIGMYKGPYFAVMEQQARLAARIISHKIPFPSEQLIEEGLKNEMKIRKEIPRGQFPHPEYVLFADTISKLGGSFPDLQKLEDPNCSLAEALGGTKSFPSLEYKKPEIAKSFMTGPVLPSHYNLMDNPKAAVNQMEFVQQVLKQFRS